MNKLLGILVCENLDLTEFYNISIETDRMRLMGNFTDELETYIFDKGFVPFQRLYDVRDESLEYKKGKIEIVLIK